jgi:hypothetical protein
MLTINNLTAHTDLTTREIKEITKSTRNRTNTTFAIVANPAAMPPKPRIAATIAPIRKTSVHFNIIITLNNALNGTIN